jgi:ferredoxin
MALKITDECIACGACVPECPTNSITEDSPVYVINAETCVECVGHFDSPQCQAVCPVADTAILKA